MIGRKTFENSYKRPEINSLLEVLSGINYSEVPPIFEALPLSQTALTLSLSNEKIGLIREYHFEEFCEQYFRSFTSWGLKIPLTEIMSYSSSLLSKSLTKLKDNYPKKAKQTFKSKIPSDILSYMKERTSSRNSLHHINKILKIGMNSPPEMCDEIFCQLVKQSNNNPKQYFLCRKSLLRAWKLFGVCSGVFGPSSKLRLSLLNHLVSIEESESPDISQRACYCICRLEKTFENGTRLVTPTIEEIKCMKAMKAFPVKVHTLSGSSMVMMLESFDNANDLKIAVIKRLKISVNKFPLFGLYEIFEEEFYEERYIDENEIIMDLVSSWQSKENMKFTLLLKIRLFIYQAVKDPILPFVYIQCAFDVLRGITLISAKLVAVLAALKLYIEMGKSKILDGFLSSNLEFYIPSPFLKNSQTSDEEWIDRVLKKYNVLPEFTKLQAQSKYVELVSKCPLFGGTVFYLVFQEASGNYTLPKEVMVSISFEYFSIYTRDHRRELMRFDYNEISSWGVSLDRLALFVAKNGYQVQFLFKTQQGSVISSLMQGYSSIKAGKPIVHGFEYDPKARKVGLSRELAIKFPPLSLKIFS